MFSGRFRGDEKIGPEPVEGTLGELLSWHFYKYGTRPGGKRRKWNRGEVKAAIGGTARRLRDTFSDAHVPHKIGPFCDALFGEHSGPSEEKARIERKFLKAADRPAWLRRLLET